MHPLLHHISQLIFPASCFACGAQLPSNHFFLCFACNTSMPYVGDYTTNNFTEKTLWGRAPFVFADSLLYFQKEGLTQKIIHQLKYKNQPQVGEWLGIQMGKKMLKMPSALWQNAILVPVPLSPKRQQQRGYNQSMEIALGIQQVTQLPISENGILRLQNTETQTHKNRMDRLANMKNAFAADSKKVEAAAHIILIDDVITTGATLESCSNTLLANEASTKISVLAAAIAMNL